MYIALLTYLAFSRRSSFKHKKRIHYKTRLFPDSQIGSVNCEEGLEIRSGPDLSFPVIALVPKGELLTILGESKDNYFKISYRNHNGFAAKKDVIVVESHIPTIRQYDSRFNLNIRKYGSAFMSCCWCAGIDTVKGCNEMYLDAVDNEWMSPECFVADWDLMKNVAKAKSYRPGSAEEPPQENEKEILECEGEYGTQFVVGDGHGGIKYDPYTPNFVQPSQCIRKHFFSY